MCRRIESTFCLKMNIFNPETHHVKTLQIWNFGDLGGPPVRAIGYKTLAHLWFLSGTKILRPGLRHILDVSKKWTGRAISLFIRDFFIFAGEFPNVELYRLQKHKHVPKFTNISHIRILRSAVRLLMMCTPETHHVLMFIKRFFGKFQILLSHQLLQSKVNH